MNGPQKLLKSLSKNLLVCELGLNEIKNIFHSFLSANICYIKLL